MIIKEVTIIVVIKGDTGSLDYSSHVVPFAPLHFLQPLPESSPSRCVS